MRTSRRVGMLIAGIIPVPAILFAFILSTEQSRMSASFPEAGENPGHHADFVAGKIIVKYRNTVTGCVHCILEKHRNFRLATADDGRTLQELHTRFGITAATPVFRNLLEERRIFGSAGVISTETLRRYHLNKLQNPVGGGGPRYRRYRDDGPVPELHHIYVLSLPAGSDVFAAVLAFSTDPHVEYAQPDYLAVADLNPNDTYYRSSGSWGQSYDDLWSLKEDKLNLAPAWDVSQGQGIVVAVVDTGVDYKHPDLASNIWSNPAEIRNNNKDDDGNGFVDDDRGWDFTTCNEFGALGSCSEPKAPGNDPMDGNFHGTHVSGTIAAVGGNGKGIIGVAPRAKILPVKGLNDNGRGQNSELAAAIVYAATAGADVINNSWSCSFCPSNPLYQDAVRAAYKLGSIVVFSAGNAARNVRSNSPQNIHDSKPIVVAASNQRDQPTYFTNFGATVDIAAPGGSIRRGESNILSLRPSPCDQCPKKLLVGDAYLRLAGTSMSAPHVSGLAALILSQRPALDLEEVRQILRASADDVQSPGFDPETGSGRINAFQALQKISPLRVAIQKPLHLSASPPRGVAIRGTASGPGFAGYQLFYRSEEEKEWIALGEPRSGPVQGGILGTLPGGSMSSGWKTVKLEATDLDGRKYSDAIDIGIQIPARRVPPFARSRSHNPDVFEDLIVWAEDVREGLSHLYVFDLASRKRHRITGTPVKFPIPTISGNVIAWLVDQNERTGDGVYYCVFNRKTGACPAKQISSNIDTGSPSVSGKYIAWDEVDGGKELIYLYDIASGVKKVIGEGNNADISGNLVVWSRVYPGRTTGDLFLYDIASGTRKQLTHNPALENRPRISDGNVYFTRTHMAPGGSHQDIYLYDLTTGKESKIVEDPQGSLEFDRSGDYIVWRHGEFEIHGFNTRTGVRQILSFQPVAIRRSPSISGKTAVWLVKDPRLEDNGDVYYMRLP